MKYPMTIKKLLEIRDNIYKLKFSCKIIPYLDSLNSKKFQIIYCEGSVDLDNMGSEYPYIFLSFNKDREIQEVQIYK